MMSLCVIYPSLSLLPVLLSNPFSARPPTPSAQNETLNLVAGLTTITEYSAANSNATTANLALMTDSDWSSTGIFNIGFGYMPELKNGTFAGDFGGGIYHNVNYEIIMIGLSALDSGTSYWGEWNVQLLLSNGTYSNPIHFTSSDTEGNNTI